MNVNITLNLDTNVDGKEVRLRLAEALGVAFGKPAIESERAQKIEAAALAVVDLGRRLETSAERLVVAEEMPELDAVRKALGDLARALGVPSIGQKEEPEG